MRYTTGCIAFLALLGLSVSCQAVELVTTCGQRVTDGVLANDLDCSEYHNDVAVWVAGSLSLAGYTITGGSSPVIYCGREGHDGKCTISGPGIVRGSDSFGIVGRKVLLDGVTSEGQSIIVVANAARLTDCVVAGDPRSTQGSPLILAKRVSVIRSSITNSSGFGIAGIRRVVLIDSTVSGNNWDGVMCRGRIELQNSSVVGNALDCRMPGCNADWITRCADISAPRDVRIDATSTCETSLLHDNVCESRNIYDYRSGTTLGVCTLD